MNLKEAFRYQKFLDTMMTDARRCLVMPSRCLNVTRYHLKSQANPDAADVEEVEAPASAYTTEQLCDFMRRLIREKYDLTAAINKAKSKMKEDVDALVEANKYRQMMAGSLDTMLKYKGSEQMTHARGYMLNADRNQVEYTYDVRLVSTENFDRAKSRDEMLRLLSASDTISAMIDEQMLKSNVDYTRRFDVNGTFEDAMEKFLDTPKVVEDEQAAE